MEIDLKELREHLEYRAETGKFYWLKNMASNKIKSGTEAGCIGTDRYIVITFSRKPHKAHRLAWLLTYGHWPQGVIDHIDGNRGNNILKNLRDVTDSQNKHNLHKISTRNKTGYTGVSWCKYKQRFLTKIVISSKIVYIGSFSTAKDAGEAYRLAKLIYHPTAPIKPSA